MKIKIFEFKFCLTSPATKTLSAFTLMVLWLYLFPLSGNMISDGDQLKWFMLAAAITFLILAHIDTRWLSRRLKWAVLLTLSFLGFIFLDTPEAYCPITLSILGICLAVIGAFVGMTLSKQTAIYAVIGIVLGNLLSYLPILLSLSNRTTIYMASVIILLLLTMDLKVEENASKTQAHKHFGNQFGVQSVFYLLPFILLFEVLAGIMYSQIWPAYLSCPNALLGIDLVPYIAALFIGYFILNKNLLLNFILAVLAAIACFILWFYAEQNAYTVYALCFMVFAVGFIDVSIIFSSARAEESYRAYVLLQGCVLLGISLGNFAFVNAEINAHLLSLIGLIVVNISLISLLLLHYYFKIRTTTQTATMAIHQDAVPPMEAKEQLSVYLSEQEYKVLTRVLEGTGYKDIAVELSVAESTVKTYMQRIYKKLNVYNLRALKQKFKL